MPQGTGYDHRRAAGALDGGELGSMCVQSHGFRSVWQRRDAPKTISANDNVALAIAA